MLKKTFACASDQAHGTHSPKLVLPADCVLFIEEKGGVYQMVHPTFLPEIKGWWSEFFSDLQNGEGCFLGQDPVRPE